MIGNLWEGEVLTFNDFDESVERAGISGFWGGVSS